MKDAPNSKRPNADVIGRNPTVIGSYLLLLARALDARGIPSREVFEQAGVSMASWHDPLQRVPVAAMRRIYEIVFDLTGDPCFGLEVSKHFQMPMLHALGHSLVASRTLREFCTRLSRSLRLVSQGAQMKLVEARDTAQLLVTDIATVVPAESEDVLCGFLFDRCEKSPAIGSGRSGSNCAEANRIVPPDSMRVSTDAASSSRSRT